MFQCYHLDKKVNVNCPLKSNTDNLDSLFCRSNNENSFWIFITFTFTHFFNTMTNLCRLYRRWVGYIYFMIFLFCSNFQETCHWLASRIPVFQIQEYFKLTYLHELSSPRLPWRKVGKNKFQLNWHKRPFPGRKMRVGGHLYWTLRWTFHKLFHSIWLLDIIVEPCYMYIKCYLEAII